MLETTQRLTNEIRELMDLMVRQIGVSGVVNMNQADFECLHKSLRVIESINNLLIVEAEIMDSQSAKLDKILSFLEKDAR